MPNIFPYKFPAILRYLDTILKDGFIFLSNIVCVKPSNLFETAIEEIRSRKVEVTFLNGRIVYSHE